MFIEKINACSISSVGEGIGVRVGPWGCGSGRAHPLPGLWGRTGGFSQPHLPRAKTSLSPPRLPEEMTPASPEISVGWDAENLKAWEIPPAPLSLSACALGSTGGAYGWGAAWLGWHHEQAGALSPNPPSLAHLHPARPQRGGKTTSRKPKFGQRKQQGFTGATPS